MCFSQASLLCRGLPLPFPKHCHYLLALHDHIHILMWVHPTQFGDQSFGLQWSRSLNLIDPVIGIFCKGCQGCTYGVHLHFLKHGSTGEVKDHGSHGEEGGEMGYRRYIQRDGLQSLQWYDDSNRIPVYRYTGIQGLQIVPRGLHVGIQIYRSTESLQRVYRWGKGTSSSPVTSSAPPWGPLGQGGDE